MTGHDLRDALAAFSLANLSLLGIWNALLYYPPSETFFLNQVPSPTQYAAAMANIFLIGVVFLVFIRVARSVYRRYGMWAAAPILFPIALPAIIALAHLMASGFPQLGTRYSFGLLTILFCVTAFVARTKTFAVCATLLVTLSPMIAIEAVLSISRCRTGRGAEYVDPPLAPLAPQHSLPRVVWIIFDELDYRLSFPERPSHLDLPQFDRLRAESVFAANAISPANNTPISVTSLLTGTNISSISSLDPSRSATRPTIFSSVHHLGGNAAADGWYLPYCRLFSADLAACAVHAAATLVTETSGSFMESVVLQLRSLLESGNFSILHPALREAARVGMIQAMRDEAPRYAADPVLDFVFLHLPTPHAPHYYDRRSRTFTGRDAGAAQRYADSLALADVILGEIRESMTRAGLWDKTTVLVSSDHPNRSSKDFDGKTDPRVPFLLKLAGQTSAVPYDAPLRTIVTKPLLEAILGAQIASPEQAVNWLHAHSSQ